MSSWASLFSKLTIACAALGVFYVVADTFHFLPGSMRNFAQFLTGNLQLFAFVFCFSVGAVVCMRAIQNKRGQHK